jgi:hypothetical protein
MNFTTSQSLGTYKAGGAIQTGLTAPITGTYTLEVSQCSNGTTLTGLELEAGDAIEIANVYNECCQIQGRIKLPTIYIGETEGYPISCALNYLTYPNGAVIFTFENKL